MPTILPYFWICYNGRLIQSDPIYQLIDERTPIRPQQGSFWRLSRRYSIVVSEVALLVFNTVFFIAKSDKSLNKRVGEIDLLLLSCVGLVSLHYTLDWVYKSAQDVRFAAGKKNRLIVSLALARTVSLVGNASLTVGNFVASVYGSEGQEGKEISLYHKLTPWGEIALGTGLLLNFTNMYVTHRTLKRLDDVAAIRYCMDKDTLWLLRERLALTSSEEAYRLIEANLATQLKVTLGAKLALSLVGDGLQAVEKVYTPDSLVSASINLAVSLAYAARIVIEKRAESKQRDKLKKSISIDQNGL